METRQPLILPFPYNYCKHLVRIFSKLHNSWALIYPPLDYGKSGKVLPLPMLCGPYRAERRGHQKTQMPENGRG
jgi:hypothetical protein